MPPFRCDYGYNISIGERTFLNYGAIILDVAPVEIRDDVQIATNVPLLATTDPLEAAVRRSGLELGRPVRVGDGAWIGSGAIVLPGVSIGTNGIVGAGSAVTRDVAGDAFVAGNPARVIGPP